MVNISGVTIGNDFTAHSGSAIKLLGGDFYLDGVPISGLETTGNQIALDIPQGAILSGTYADGTPFFFSHRERRWRSIDFDSGVLTLEATELPDFAPEVVTITTHEQLSTARRNQTVIVPQSNSLPDYFLAGAGSVINVQGGEVGSDFRSLVGSVVNLSEGVIRTNFTAEESEVNISGGSIQGGFTSYGSEVNITGGTIGYGFGVNFGIGARNDSIVNITGGESGSISIRSGSVVNLSGGTVRTSSVGDGSILNISGGTISAGLRIHEGSTANISGGTLGDNFEADAGSTLNISGGTIGDDFEADEGSTVNFIGTAFRYQGLPIEGLTPGVTVTIDIDPYQYFYFEYEIFGGRLADGTSFHYDAPILQENFSEGAAITVTLLPEDFLAGDFNDDGEVDAADYTVWRDNVGQEADALSHNFHFGIVGQPEYHTWIDNFGRTLNDLSPPASVLNIPNPDSSIGDNGSIDSNTQLNLSDGGAIGNYFSAGDPFGSSTNVEVNITGGTIGEGFNARTGSEVNISGGTFSRKFRAFDGSVVNITGGDMGYDFTALLDSEVNISGGNLVNLNASDGSTVNISGGDVTHGLSASLSEVNVSGGNIGYLFIFAGGMVNISGGTVGDDSRAYAGSTVNLTGTEFLIDGLAIDGLTAEMTVTIDAADYSLLTGTLANGAVFDFDTFFPNADFRAGSMLTVTLLPGNFLAGDYNGDGQVDAADYTVWRDSVGQDSDVLANNFHSGIVGQPEYDTWIENFGGVLTGMDFTSVPEPTTLASTLLLALGAITGRRRRQRESSES